MLKMTSVEAIIFVGCPASGKSSFFKQQFFDTHIRVNLDMLRTRRRETLLIEACINAKQRFVVDNTNPTVAERKKYVDVAVRGKFSVCAYLFNAEYDQLIQRNMLRSGKARVPEVAIRATLSKLQRPTGDEGFDSIYSVHLNEDGLFEVTRVL
jgi:predicted kinase